MLAANTVYSSFVHPGWQNCVTGKGDVCHESYHAEDRRTCWYIQGDG